MEQNVAPVVHTLESVRKKLEEDQQWIEQAIKRLFELQTNDEQQSEMTRASNGVGFNAFDAKRLTYYAKWLNRGNHLTGNHLTLAKKMMPKYAGQVLRMIEQRN